MARCRPGKTAFALVLLLSAGSATDANAQAATGLNFSNLPFSPSQLPRPAPLVPEPGGAFTSQTVTMPVPPLARTTIPSADAPQNQTSAADAPAAAQHEDGPSHASLDDRALDSVR